MSNTDNKSARIEWLAVLQGFSMLLVVLGHVSLTGTFQDPGHPVAAAMERVIYSFHMPLFIFISGWLFYLTCIKRNTTYKGMLTKKLSRLGIPFLFFTIITMLIKLAMSSLVRRPVDVTEIINTFILFSSNPLEEMWFITVLLILMAIYPVYRWLTGHDATAWGLVAALIIYIILPTDIRVFRLSAVARMAPYFIAGIMCCRYGIIEKYASKWWVAAVALTLFIAVNVMQTADPYLPEKAIRLTQASAGIALSVCMCAFITILRPTAFSSFRDYTFQIFLLGIFFQMAVRIVYSRTGHLSEAVYPLLFAVSVIVGTYIPVIISKTIQRHLPKAGKLLGLS